jgi:NAD dependent epimerase/dehydratase family enzyme
MSWIHRDDWVELVIWALGNSQAAHAFNATAPAPVTNEHFMKAFGRSVGRPSWLRVPGFALKMLYGEMADPALIKGQRVIPGRATQLGFKFRFPTVEEALADAMSKTR